MVWLILHVSAEADGRAKLVHFVGAIVSQVPVDMVERVRIMEMVLLVTVHQDGKEQLVILLHPLVLAVPARMEQLVSTLRTEDIVASVEKALKVSIVAKTSMIASLYLVSTVDTVSTGSTGSDASVLQDLLVLTVVLMSMSAPVIPAWADPPVLMELRVILAFVHLEEQEFIAKSGQPVGQVALH